MALTTDQIIQAVRDRTGNKKDVAVGEQYVPDQAILSGLRGPIIECNSAFGQSSQRKEVGFWVTPGLVLNPPSIPILTPSTLSGNLPDGTYNYQVTALLGAGETQSAGQANTSAVLSATGQVTVSWTAVQRATSYNIYGRIPNNPSNPPGLLAGVPGSSTAWTDTGVAVPGSGLPGINSTGGNGTYQQDYDIATYIGPDVEEIIDVLRSDAYVGDSTIMPMQVDPRTGVPFARAAFIDQAYQQDVLDVISAQQRWNRQRQYDWEVVNTNGSPVLRLMPPPTENTYVSVRYIGTAEDIESLPEEARVALEYAGCVALLDAVIDRVNSDPSGMGESARDRRYWIESVERQRDRYEQKYRAELRQRPK